MLLLSANLEWRRELVVEVEQLRAEKAVDIAHVWKTVHLIQRRSCIRCGSWWSSRDSHVVCCSRESAAGCQEVLSITV